MQYYGYARYLFSERKVDKFSKELSHDTHVLAICEFFTYQSKRWPLTKLFSLTVI